VLDLELIQAKKIKTETENKTLDFMRGEFNISNDV
jgi:hypothetical protein